MSLETVQEIERAIGTLAPREIEQLYAWLNEHFPMAIDGGISSSVAAGPLDKAIFRALDDEVNARLRLL